jgi:cytochrome c oxidase cbb3-type subunit 3
MADRERDDVSGTEMTGHEWDGIKELDTPMPRWWLWTFFATVVWSLGYVVAYPAIPLINGATPGLLGYSSRADVVDDIADAKVAQSGQTDKILAMPLDDVRKHPDLFAFAVAGGRAAFQVNCIQCHGTGAAGGPGYPNLNDDDWLWGGTLDQIYATLQHGIRYDADADTRQSQMPNFGTDGVLERPQIADTAEYVLKLAGGEHDADAATRGAELFAANCAACHGEDGEGNRELGAPKLSDAVALYGTSRESILGQISRPRHGVMPAWGGRLDEATLRKLAVYVHALGGGEAASQ